MVFYAPIPIFKYSTRSLVKIKENCVDRSMFFNSNFYNLVTRIYVRFYLKNKALNGKILISPFKGHQGTILNTRNNLTHKL